MREFASKKARLRRLGLTQRIVYTLFLAYLLAGLASAVLLYDAGPGWTLESVRVYYRGGELPGDADSASEAAGSGVTDEPISTGPAIDLPDVNPANERSEPASQRIAHPRSYRQILENTHQHLFMMSVAFLIVAHLFVLAGLRRRWVVLGIGLAAFGIAGHLAAPWLIRWVSGGWAWLMPVTLAAMLLGLGGMIAVALVAMWWPGGRSQSPP